MKSSCPKRIVSIFAVLRKTQMKVRILRKFNKNSGRIHGSTSLRPISMTFWLDPNAAKMQLDGIKTQNIESGA
jgi:hypothetical protein